MNPDFNGFTRDCERVAKQIKEHIDQGHFIQVFSHMDTDGLTAGAILAKGIYRAGGHFNLRIIKGIDEAIVKSAQEMGHRVYVFTEIGSGYLDLLQRISDSDLVVIDHHKPVEASAANLTHVNPVSNGYDGAKDISGSGVTYFVAKNLGLENKDLSVLAILGALGDLQDKNKARTLAGLNQLVVKDAVEAGMISAATDLLFYGRETRAFHKAMASTMNPFIPGLSGEEDKCLGFVTNLRIPLKEGDRWRTLSDLTHEEKQLIFSEIAKYLASKRFSDEFVFGLIGTVYTLSHEDKWTPLRDAREYSSLLNACAKLERASTGISLCMGERGAVLEEAQQILSEYRRSIARYLNTLTNSPDRIKTLDALTVVNCNEIVEENMLSPIATILFTSSAFAQDKPMIATTLTKTGEVKISARASETLVSKGLHIGLIMQTASEKIGGRGGGHNVAAGATIPLAETERFVEIVNASIREVLGNAAS